MRSSTLSRAFVAVRVDVPALDELEHEVRLAGVRDAGVDQPGDVRMGEPREDGALAPEALFAAAADQRGVEQLDRDLAFEAAVAARRQPHAAHAAVADRATSACRRRSSRRPATLRPARAASAASRNPSALSWRCSFEHRLDVGGDLGILAPDRLQAGVALAGGRSSTRSRCRLARSQRALSNAFMSVRRPSGRSADADAGRCAPSPSRAARCAPRRPACRRSRRTRSRRRT